MGFGSIGELPGPFPGYTASVPKDCASFVRALQGNGYSTAGFGKWHLTPDHLQGAAGPFDRWPNAWGFDHFWGFLGGEAGQYDPVITQDNTTLGVPEGEDGEEYYLPDDLTDQAAKWLHTVRAQDQTKPWFIYYSTGCAHAPHHVAMEWSEKYRGKFDQGWDALREETFERQKKLGVIPPDAVLTPRPDALPAWDSLSDSEKQLYARQMEVYAGYQENADWNVGRLLDAVEEMGELDNTLVIYIFGDNGASMEGTITGSFNELTMQNGIALTPEQQLSLIDRYGGLDAWGTDAFAPHYASAWAWAGNAPFQWGKQVASHLGGTRNGMVVSWPQRIRDAGGSRSQFTHCIDIGPTILEAAGIPAAQGGGRDRAEADGGDELPVQLRRRERGRAAHRAVLRDLRQPGDLQGRLVGGVQARPHPLGRVAADDREIRPRSLRPRAGHVGAVLPARRLHAGATTSPREHPEKLAELKELFWDGGREAQRPAADGGILGLLRDPAADADDHDAHVLRRRREHRLRDDPPRLRALVRDRGRALSARAGSRGRDRRRSGRDGRLLALGRRQRAAAPQLLDDGRRAVPAGLDRADPDRGRHRPHAVRRRQRRSARPEERSRCTPTTSRSARAGSRGLCFSASPPTPAWTSAATTAWSSTAPTRPRLRTPFTGTVKKVVFDLKPAARHEDEKALHEAAAHGATAHGISA